MNPQDLLTPLDVDSPCGADLSFSSEFDTLQELRRADDPTLSQGDWVAPLKTADWPGAAALCTELLNTRTKDLRIAGSLMEAWAHLRGFEGLADGLTLAHGLCDAFWPSLHPQPEAGDFELRIGAISRLLAQASTLASALPLIGRAELSYALMDMEAAQGLQKTLSKARDPSSVPTDGKVAPEAIQKAQRDTPPALLAERLAAAQRADAALKALQAVVDGHLGLDGPAFSAAKAAMDKVVHTLERLARGVSGTTSTATAEGVGADADAAAGAGFGGAPGSRAQALAQLRLVAEFFRRTEPHSPVAYLADRAAHWGELSLHDWLRTVLKDGGTLAQLEELLGVPPRADDQ